MKYVIRGNKIKITTAIQSYIESKMQKLDKYFKEGDLTAHILVKLNGPMQVIEVTVPGDKFTLRAEERNEDLYAAIDLVVDKLERQIRKNKTRLNSKRVKNIHDFNYEEILSIEDDNTSKVVKRKVLELKPMTEEEAILQMELLNHDFFIFKNEKNNKYNVIYKRKDGEYGIIEVK